jgi:gliding motility-associated-like protein
MIHVVDRFGCFYEGTTILTDPEEFEISLGNDRMIQLGEPVHLSLTYSETPEMISWGNQWPENNNENTLSFLPLEDMYVSVSAINADGCEASTSVQISVDTDVSLYLSNIFSPNGDGVNDEFTVSAFGLSLESIANFQIYNRWGGLIWEASHADPGLAWNGRDRIGI